MLSSVRAFARHTQQKTSLDSRIAAEVLKLLKADTSHSKLKILILYLSYK